MPSIKSSETFRVIATRCGSCGCGCPTILEGGADELVIVGKLNPQVSDNAAIKDFVGQDEIAVTIPKSLLLEAAKALA
ncbi:MAG TPA: hypothetical protein VH858_12905 [Hyphomicrobiales bacterium]